MGVGIVGGGIAGLSLAVGLEQIGVEVTVVEREPQWSTSGAAIALRPLALRALRRLGLLERVVAAGRWVDRNLVVTLDGAVIRDQPYPEADRPLAIHRRALQSALGESMQAATVHFGASVESLVKRAGCVEITVSDGSRSAHDALIAADGVNSSIRERFLEGAQVRTNGQFYWRFCVEGEHVNHWHSITGSNSFAAFVALPGLTYCAAQVFHPGGVRDLDSLRASFLDVFGDYPDPMPEVLRRLDASVEVHFGPVREVVLSQQACDSILAIGDAAHSMSPVLAAGGGLAIEDAAVLTQEIRRHGVTPNALRSFAQLREGRIETIRELANALVAAQTIGAPFDLATYEHHDREFHRDIWE